jgi:hypothetical protein
MKFILSAEQAPGRALAMQKAMKKAARREPLAA